MMASGSTAQAVEISLPNIVGYEYESDGVRHQIYALRGTSTLFLAQYHPVNGWGRGTTVDNPEYAIHAGMRDPEVKSVMMAFITDTGD